MADRPTECSPACSEQHTYLLGSCGLSCAPLHGSHAHPAWTVPCPERRCQARPHQPCRRSDGTPSAIVHGERCEALDGADRRPDDRPTAADDLRNQVRNAVHTSGRAQITLAADLGISEKHLSQMLTGRARLTIEWAEKILRACDGDLHITVLPSTLQAPAERLRLDDLTSDQLDALCDRLRRAELAVTLLTDAHARAERAEQQLAEACRLLSQWAPRLIDSNPVLFRKLDALLQLSSPDAAPNVGINAHEAIDRVRALHTRDEDADYCTVCSNHGDVQWPCATIAALDGAQQPDTAGEDGHTGACAPPCCAVDPNPAEHPNGAHTDAHDR